MQVVAYEWLFVLLYAYTMADSAEFASEISQQDFRCALLLLMLTFFRMYLSVKELKFASIIYLVSNNQKVYGANKNIIETL